MVTKNLRNFISRYITWDSSFDISSAKTQLRGLDGVWYEQIISRSANIGGSKYSNMSFTGNDTGLDPSVLFTDFNYSGGCLLVGTSDAPESPDDYNLLLVPASDLEHISLIEGVGTFNADNEREWTMSRTFKYIGVSPTTIKEVGLFKETFIENSTLSNLKPNSPTKLLMARSVLPEPINVTTGQIFTVSMTLVL